MLNFAGSALGSIAAFVAVLGLVVVIHELGHFSVAKLFGVKIDRFSIGFGKTLWSRTDRSGVQWRLAALPLGGYVKFSGDLDVTGVPDKRGLQILKEDIVERDGPGAERAYYHFKPIWQRALIVAAGPMANFILSFVIFTCIALASGQEVLVKPRVGTVEAGSPAAVAGFQPGDLVLTADGRSIERWDDVVQYVRLRAGETVRFEVDRAGERAVLEAEIGSRQVENPIDHSQVRLGYLGMTNTGDRADVTIQPYTVPEAAAHGARTVYGVVDSTVTYLGRIVTGHESGDQISGPVGIFRATGAVAGAAVDSSDSAGQAAERVFFSLLTLAGLLSVGVGFLNLLPVPVLDGGHLLFYAYEAVARRPLPGPIQEAGFRVGLALLVGFMLFATWNDLSKLNLFAFLGGSS